MNRNGVSLFLMFAVCSWLSHSAIACNIPVFRYALERWEPDDVQVIVFHDQALTYQQKNTLSDLESEQANLNVLTYFRDEELDEELTDLLGKTSATEDAKLPIAIVRSRVGRGQQFTIWSGPLAKLSTIGMTQSPVRNELSTRLLAGDSGVWIVLKSNDEEKSQAVIDLLEDSLPKIASQIPFPEGIGLPGSELFSPIPLDMRFSVLEIDADDPEEQFLVNWLTALRPEAFADSEPLIVPVFGRGRALEVLPASDLSPGLVQQLCQFLCGACSCQVKDLNPGFDLLMKADWQTELFGDEYPDIPENEPTQLAENSEPQYVPIPTGLVSSSKNGISDAKTAVDDALIEANGFETDSRTVTSDGTTDSVSEWIVLAFVSIAVIVAGLSALKV